MVNAQHSERNAPDHCSSIDLSIIIVAWNVWDLLRACLQSIEQVSRTAGAGEDHVRLFGPAHERHTLEVIVVDNASSDATVAGLGVCFPWVRLLANQENRGFTRGNNDGYRISRGRFVFFLNPDTELVKGNSKVGGRGGQEPALWVLYRALVADEGIGLVGPQLRYADNSLQNNRHRFPTLISALLESTWLGRAWPGNPWAQRMHMAEWPTTIRHEVDWLTGAALFARRAALTSITEQPVTQGAPLHGPFDEGFFMYSEEVDLCRRLKAAGWRILYIPEAVVVHYEGKSSEQVVAARHIHFNTSKVRYFRKWFGPARAEVLRTYLLLEFRIQLWLERAKWLVGHKRSLRAQRIAAYQEVITSGLR
jgi:hypothetical protein